MTFITEPESVLNMASKKKLNRRTIRPMEKTKRKNISQRDLLCKNSENKVISLLSVKHF